MKLGEAGVPTLQASSCVTVFLIECIRCRRKAVSTVLSSYLGCGPEDLPLSISPFGKWKLLRPSSEFPIEFSVCLATAAVSLRLVPEATSGSMLSADG